MLARVLALGGALWLGGCQALLHEKGKEQLVVQAAYGDPIKSNVLFYHSGRGRARSWSGTVAYHHFVTDRLALAGALTPVRIYKQPADDVWAVEAQVGLHWVPLQWRLRRVPMGAFFDVLGGVTHSESQVPPGGDEWNFTVDLGLGLEIGLDDKWSVLGGYRLRHLSNGEGKTTSSNPSQNDNLWFLGVAFRW